MVTQMGKTSRVIPADRRKPNPGKSKGYVINPGSSVGVSKTKGKWTGRESEVKGKIAGMKMEKAKMAPPPTAAVVTNSGRRVKRAPVPARMSNK